MILCDRKQLKNPNGLILGTPGLSLIHISSKPVYGYLMDEDENFIIDEGTAIEVCAPFPQDLQQVFALHGLQIPDIHSLP